MKRLSRYVTNSFQTYAAHSTCKNLYKTFIMVNVNKLPGNSNSMLFGSPDDRFCLLGDPNVFFHGIGKSIDYRFEFNRPFGIEEGTKEFGTFLQRIFFKYKYLGDKNTGHSWDVSTDKSILRILQSPIGYYDLMRIARMTLDYKKFIKFRMLFEEGIYWCNTRIGADLSLCDLLAIIFRGDPISIEYLIYEALIAQFEEITSSLNTGH